MSKEKPSVRYKKWAEEHSIFATTAETVGIAAVKYGIQSLGQKINVNLINANPEVKEIHERSLSEAALLFTVAAPLEEELTFRAVPQAVSGYLKNRGHDSSAKAVVRAADMLFVMAHSGLFIKNEGGQIKPNLKVNRVDHAIPAGPYIAAKQYRRLAETRGIRYAVYAHSLNNALALAERTIRKSKS
ncbi:CPBP family intramembrane metalloprotease [Candidatus Saccharibacteria bacterium]|nr:CPBP family intramembrane metalloprotease [Candidatus Saccharibacteria bacterium]